MTGHRILVIEADPVRRGAMAFGLRCAGFQVIAVASRAEMAASLSGGAPDLFIVSERSARARAALIAPLHEDPFTASIPIIAVSDHGAADAPESQRRAVSDYLAWPLDPEEFIARVQVALRKATRGLTGTVVEFGHVQFDRSQRLLTHKDARVELAPTEARLLELLLTHANEAVPREFVRFRLWGSQGDVSRRAVDVSVCRLRAALETLGAEDLLHTLRGKGYRLSTSPTRARHRSPLARSSSPKAGGARRASSRS